MGVTNHLLTGMFLQVLNSKKSNNPPPPKKTTVVSKSSFFEIIKDIQSTAAEAFGPYAELGPFEKPDFLWLC